MSAGIHQEGITNPMHADEKETEAKAPARQCRFAHALGIRSCTIEHQH